MRRCVIAIIVVLAAIAAVIAVAVPAAISTRLAKAEIAERLSGWTGGRVMLRGDAVVSLFPAATVEVTDVVVSRRGADGEPPLVAMASLNASLRILPLLAGRIEVGTLTLVTPRIHIAVDEAGDGDWRTVAAKGFSVLRGISSRLAGIQLSEIVLRDGAITYEDRRARHSYTIAAANLRFSWERAVKAAVLSGTFEWRGRTVEVDAELDTPAAVLNGTGSRGRLTVAAAPAERQGRDVGHAGPEERAGDSGRPGPSLRRFAERLGIPIAGSKFGPVAVSGTFLADQTTLTISDAIFQLDGNAAEGTLALRLEGDQPALQGSLAFGELDLTPYTKGLLPSNMTLAELFALPVSADWLPQAQVDITVSADELDIAGYRFTDAAMTVSMRDGGISFALQEAMLGSGRVQGNVTVAPAEAGIAARLSVRLADMSVSDAGRLVWAVRGNRLIGGGDIPLQGTGSAAVDLTATGATVGALARSLAGRIVADIRDGTLDGVDIIATLERLTEGKRIIAEGDAPFLWVTGRTPFAMLRIELAIEAGVARARKIRLGGERFDVRLSGEGDIRRGEMEAEGTASLFASESGDENGPIVELPFGVGGTVREPVTVPGIPRIGRQPVGTSRRSRT